MPERIAKAYKSEAFLIWMQAEILGANVNRGGLSTEPTVYFKNGRCGFQLKALKTASAKAFSHHEKERC